MNAAGAVFLAALAVYIAFAMAMARRGKPGQEAQGSLATFTLSIPPFLVVCCTGLQRAARRHAVIAAYAQSALFALACYFGSHMGVFSRHLISPVYIALGLLAGHLIFGISLLITQRSVSAAAVHFVDFGSLWNFAVESPRVLMQFIVVSVSEELIYRVGAQPLAIAATGSPMLGIVIVAIAFSLVHEHFFRNSALQSGEFFAFAIALGALYYATGSLILVIVIHAVRNIEIAFLEYLIRVDELESEEAAAREAELTQGERLLVFLVLPVLPMSIACLEYVGGPDAAPAPANRFVECA